MAFSGTGTRPRPAGLQLGLVSSIDARTCKSQDVISSRLRQRPERSFSRPLSLCRRVGCMPWKRRNPVTGNPLRPKGLPLNHEQILKHLRTAKEVARKRRNLATTPLRSACGAGWREGADETGKPEFDRGCRNRALTASVRVYSPDYLWRYTVMMFEPCVMCAGNIYWANIGNLVYGVEETTLKKLTGANKNNPTMSLPCRTVFKRQKPILVRPFSALDGELVAPHRPSGN